MLQVDHKRALREQALALTPTKRPTQLPKPVTPVVYEAAPTGADSHMALLPQCVLGMTSKHIVSIAAAGDQCHAVISELFRIEFRRPDPHHF